MGNGNEDKEKSKREELTPKLKFAVLSWLTAIVGIPSIVVFLGALYFIGVLTTYPEPSSEKKEKKQAKILQ